MKSKMLYSSFCISTDNLVNGWDFYRCLNHLPDSWFVNRGIDATLCCMANSHKVSSMGSLSHWFYLICSQLFLCRHSQGDGHYYSDCTLSHVHSLCLNQVGAFLSWSLFPQYEQESWSFGDGPSAASLFCYLHVLRVIASVACGRSSHVADVFLASLASTNLRICSRVTSWFLSPSNSSCISESSNPWHSMAWSMASL